jgi:hypothetical protein
MTAINQKNINWAELHAREGQLFSVNSSFFMFHQGDEHIIPHHKSFGSLPKSQLINHAHSQRTSNQTKTLLMMSTNANFEPKALTF